MSFGSMYPLNWRHFIFLFYFLLTYCKIKVKCLKCYWPSSWLSLDCERKDLMKWATRTLEDQGRLYNVAVKTKFRNLSGLILKSIHVTYMLCPKSISNGLFILFIQEPCSQKTHHLLTVKLPYMTSSSFLADEESIQNSVQALNFFIKKYPMFHLLIFHLINHHIALFNIKESIFLTEEIFLRTRNVYHKPCTFKCDQIEWPAVLLRREG